MKRLIFVLAAAATLAPAMAFATKADDKAALVCTGQKKITDYPRFILTTDICKANVASTCTIQRKTDATIKGNYSCPGSTSSGGGGTTPKPSIQE